MTSYAEVAAKLRHPQLSAERVLIDPAWAPDSAQSLVESTIRALSQQMIFRDGLIMHGCAGCRSN